MLAQDLLWGVALEQRGLFTMREALGSGVSRKAVEHLVARHEVERAGHGVFRFPGFPTTAQDRFQLAVLWTGTEAACLSHETALEAHGVTGVMADRIHLTVPAHRRIRRAGGDAYCVHRQNLAAKQVGWWEQIPMVTLPTAIDQCLDYGTPSYLIRQAISQGADTGALLVEEAEALVARLSRRESHGG